MDAKEDERHIICTVRAKPEHRDEVKMLLLELVGPSRSEPGCLYYDLYQDGDTPDTFFIVDGWVSESAIAEHLAHPNVPRVVERLLPLLVEPLHNSTSRRLSDSA